MEVPNLLGRTGRWVGLDDNGRPLELSPADMQARGWSLTPQPR